MDLFISAALSDSLNEQLKQDVGSTVTVSHSSTATSSPHVAPLGLLVAIFSALLALTVVTVAAAYQDFGDYNLVIALLIATVKASLVAWYFMHLAHDSGFNRLAFFGSFLFVALFVGFTLMDSGQYQDAINWHETVQSP